MSFRCVRSPVAPKMTNEQGSGLARPASPARIGLEDFFSLIIFVPSLGRESYLPFDPGAGQQRSSGVPDDWTVAQGRAHKGREPGRREPARPMLETMAHGHD